MTPAASSPKFSHRLTYQSDTLPVLFETIGQQVMGVLLDPADISDALREKIALEAENPEALLEMWVAALLDLIQEQRMVLKKFKIDLKIDPKGTSSLKAEILGELLDPQRHLWLENPSRIKLMEVHLAHIDEVYHAEVVLA